MSDRVRTRLALLLSEGLPERLRNRAALVLAVMALVFGTLFLAHRVDIGVAVAEGDSGLVISWVEYGGLAWQAGARAGMRVYDLNNVSEPTQPVPPRDIYELSWIAQEGTGEHGEEEALAGSISQGLFQWRLGSALPGPILAAVILAAAGWWLTGPRSRGSHLAPLLLPAAAATAVPLAIAPGPPSATQAGLMLGAALPALAMIPLADALADYVWPVLRQRLVRVAALSAGAGAVALLPLLILPDGGEASVPLLRGLLVVSAVLLPGAAAAAAHATSVPGQTGSTSAQAVKPIELLVLGLTPAIAVAGTSLLAAEPQFWPLLLWFAGVLAVRRWTIRPLLRVVQRVQLQRDLVVAATEAERARLAADLHDEALQGLTLLVRRLDTAGDHEGAELARTVADQLRQICGDLRLPILDDLGAGPALEWLVERVGRLAGGEVRLERIDPLRPPTEVELAVFRVAQEALANAVKHGGVPIVVRYQSTSGRVSLSIEDAGPGIATGAGEAAAREGRFGLLNMQQRAEQIGAILDVRRWPAGGTRVALDWRAG